MKFLPSREKYHNNFYRSIQTESLDAYAKKKISNVASVGYYVFITTTKFSDGPCELNLRSKGNWITVGINLPEDLELSEVVLDSIRINGTLQVELHPLRYNNKNNSYELMIKLRRAAIEDFLLRALPTGKASFIPVSYTHLTLPTKA